MKIKKFTVILTFPNIADLTGFAMVNAADVNAAGSYAFKLFPEHQCRGAQVIAVQTGWHYPERLQPDESNINHAPGYSIRAFPLPLAGSHPALPVADREPTPEAL